MAYRRRRLQVRLLLGHGLKSEFQTDDHNLISSDMEGNLIVKRGRARAVFKAITEGKFDWLRENGFTCSDGGIRFVWIHKESNLVYKVNSYEEDAEYSNKGEYRRAKAMKKLEHTFSRVKIPEVSLFNFSDGDILVMTYIEGTLGFMIKNHNSSPYIEAYNELQRVGKFEDMHGRNYIFDKQLNIWPIDMGSPRRNPYIDASVDWSHMA